MRALKRAQREQRGDAPIVSDNNNYFITDIEFREQALVTNTWSFIQIRNPIHFIKKNFMESFINIMNYQYYMSY